MEQGDDDARSIAALLRVPTGRIVTLTGPGGVGKTTPATAVLNRVHAEFPGRVVMVELADLIDGVKK